MFNVSFRTTQISRLLQDAKIMKLPSTQLDLQLVKIHARLSAQVMLPFL